MCDVVYSIAPPHTMLVQGRWQVAGGIIVVLGQRRWAVGQARPRMVEDGAARVYWPNCLCS